MKLQKLLILLIIVISLVPVYYVNRWLQQFIQPRRSFFRFIIYMLTCFGLVFLYTFLLVSFILKLFPVSKG